MKRTAPNYLTCKSAVHLGLRSTKKWQPHMSRAICGIDIELTAKNGQAIEVLFQRKNGYLIARRSRISRAIDTGNRNWTIIDFSPGYDVLQEIVISKSRCEYGATCTRSEAAMIRYSEMHER